MEDMNEGVKWELTLTIGPARKILELAEVAYGEGMGPDVGDILRAIAWQHPGLVEEFSSLYRGFSECSKKKK